MNEWIYYGGLIAALALMCYGCAGIGADFYRLLRDDYAREEAREATERIRQGQGRRCRDYDDYVPRMGAWTDEEIEEYLRELEER